jgi:hypothetical protein
MVESILISLSYAFALTGRFSNLLIITRGVALGEEGL